MFLPPHIFQIQFPMRSLFTICLCFGILISAFSQNSQQFSIFFDHDRSDISPAAAQTLDQVMGSLATAADFEINLNAYTDNTGSDTYNRALAQSRAEMVQAYLGIFTGKITVSSWGESRQKSTNNTEEGRQQNRRVDLELKLWSINSQEDFEARLRSQPDPVYAVANNTEQTIRTSGGTIVVIPPGSFVFEDGTEPTGNIDITIREALTPADWIINGLATTSNGEILQSGGMMYISASAGGRELQLAEGAEITVALPALKGVDKDMQLFYGQHDQNNTVSNWQPAGSNSSFRQTLKNSAPYSTASPELCAQMRQIKIDIPELPVLPNFEPMNYPVMPEAPYKPRLRPAPEWSKFAKNYSSDGHLKGKKLKKAQEEFAKQQERYQQDSVKYAAAMETYYTRYAQYQNKLAVYEKEKVMCALEENRRLKAARKYMEAEKVYQYTQVLTKVLKTAGVKKPFRYNYTISEAIKKRVESTLSYKYFSSKYYGAWDPEAPVYKAVFGVNNIKNNKDLRRMIKDGSNRICGDWRYVDSSYIKFKEILTSSGIKALSDSMYTVDLEKRALTSTGIHQQHAMASYVTEITQLGWINVDRFSKDTNPRIVLSFEAPDAFAMYAYLPQLNSMLMLSKNEETGVFSVAGVPEGQPVRLMTLKTENGQLWVNQQQITAGKTKDPVFDYTAYSMQAFRKELGRLN